MNEFDIRIGNGLRIIYIIFSGFTSLFISVPIMILSENKLIEIHLGVLLFLLLWSAIPFSIIYVLLSYALLPYRISKIDNALYKQSVFHHYLIPKLIGKPKFVYIIDQIHHNRNSSGIFPSLWVVSKNNKRYGIGSEQTFTNVKEANTWISKNFNCKSKIIDRTIG